MASMLHRRPRPASCTGTDVRLAIAGLTAAVLLAACSVADDGPRTSGSGAPHRSGPGTAAIPTAGATSDGTPAASGLRWGNCAGAARAQLQCATLTVPLDHDDAAGGTIDMAVARLAANGQQDGAAAGLPSAAAIGPRRVLITNPGGPGASGIEFLATWAPTLSSAVRADTDVVSFDPRGVGDSAALQCVPFEQALQSAPSGLSGAAVVTEAATAAAGAREAARACQSRSGQLLPHLGTADVARDMDLLRAALAVPRIDFVGFSYGTRLGTVYAQLFPGRLRTLTLDGSVSPRETQMEFALGQARGGVRALQSFAAWCATRNCGLRPSAGAVWDRIVSAAERSPLPVRGEAAWRVDGGLATTGMFSGLYSPTQWPTLLAAMKQAEQGDGTMLFTLAQLQFGEPVDGFSADVSANLAINCADLKDRPSRAQVIAAARTAIQTNPRLGGVGAVSALSCDGWRPGSEPVGPVNLSDPPPTIVVGTRNDPATPYEWAVAMSRAIPGARLITYAGDGHTAYGRSACVTRTVDSFLTTARLPSSDTTCAVRPQDGRAQLRSAVDAQLGAALIEQGLPTTAARCVAARLAAKLPDSGLDQLLAGETPDGLPDILAGLTRACLAAP